MNNPYGDDSINVPSYTPNAAVTKSITSSAPAPTPEASKPLTLGGSPDFSAGSSWL
jgi:hypothetical protein